MFHVVADHASFAAQGGLAVGDFPDGHADVAMQLGNMAEEMIIAGRAGAAAQDMGFLRDQNVRALVGSADGRHKSGNAAADDKNVCFYNG